MNRYLEQNSLNQNVHKRLLEYTMVDQKKLDGPRKNLEKRVFFRKVTNYFDRTNLVTELRSSYSTKTQSRFSVGGWPKIGNKQTGSIYYEFDDWEEQKTKTFENNSEISVEIQFWAEDFAEIGEIIQKQKEQIAEKMPGNPRIVWDIKIDYRWHRLQFFFPDSTDPKIIAKSMIVLVDETREIVNDWLKENKFSHY